MKLLLDTHVFLWFINGDSKLSANVRSLIEDLDNERYLSIASIWEMAIKNSLGKLTFDEPIDQLIPYQLALNRIDVLPVLQAHIYHAGRLPLHHRDPFDRMLIAQSITENIALLSADNAFDDYAELTLIR